MEETKDAGGINGFYQKGRRWKSIGWWMQAETAGAPKKAGGRQACPLGREEEGRV